ncbi:transposase [Streptomyces mirabilis]|uniref:transposase n=1 Tax=Streptomyces mirabilis TaxID=68239 RepID=UPI0036A44AE0
MTAPDSLPLHALAEDNLAAASPDLLRAMVKTFADALMSAEADVLCNAEYGQVSDERVNHRNGYRPREWDTRAGTVELAIPKLRPLAWRRVARPPTALQRRQLRAVLPRGPLSHRQRWTSQSRRRTPTTLPRTARRRRARRRRGSAASSRPPGRVRRRFG